MHLDLVAMHTGLDGEPGFNLGFSPLPLEMPNGSETCTWGRAQIRPLRLEPLTWPWTVLRSMLGGPSNWILAGLVRQCTDRKSFMPYFNAVLHCHEHTGLDVVPDEEDKSLD